MVVACRWLVPALMAVACAACGDAGAGGLVLHVNIDPAAFASLARVTITLDDPTGHLGQLPSDVTEAGAIVHTQDGQVRFELIRGAFALRTRFDLRLIPSGAPVTVSVRGEMENAAGDALGSTPAGPAVAVDAARPTTATLDLACAQAECAPLAKGRAIVHLMPAPSLPPDWFQINDLDLQVWDENAKCSTTTFGFDPNGGGLIARAHLGDPNVQTAFDLIAGRAYLFYVRAYADDRAGMLLAGSGCTRIPDLPGHTSIDVTIAAGPPDDFLNDKCNGRDGLLDPNNMTANRFVNMMGAIDDFAGSCGGAGLPDRVFWIRVVQRSEVIINSTASFDHVLYLRGPSADPMSPDCGTVGSELACPGPPAHAQRIQVGVPAGNYFLFVDGDPTGAPSNTIQVAFQATPM